MTRKMNKKTRNVLSGILVSIASLFAVINFAELPAGEVGNFMFSTTVFFLGIVLLALVTVSLFKLLGMLRNSLNRKKDQSASIADPEFDKPQAEADNEGKE
jgi:hypothetical protein